MVGREEGHKSEPSSFEQKPGESQPETHPSIDRGGIEVKKKIHFPLYLYFGCPRAIKSD